MPYKNGGGDMSYGTNKAPGGTHSPMGKLSTQGNSYGPSTAPEKHVGAPKDRPKKRGK